jgi:hypothetical protein
LSDRALARLRALLVLNLVVLVVVRLVRDADDFNNWDLISFLNANSFDSLRALLRRPEIHLLRPFSFPLYNVGAESVPSALMFRALGHVSLYWSNAVVLLVYDAIFVFLLQHFLRLLWPDAFLRTTAWLLLSLSPVLLTFLSTSAFNMQGYIVLLLGLVGSEHFLQGRVIRGTLLLALAFLVISQGYPLGFFLPYFAAVWLVYRTCVGGFPLHGRGAAASWPRRLVLNVTYAALVGGLAWGVNRLSHGVYFGKISPTNPHDMGNQLSALGTVLQRFWFFTRQAFWPVRQVDGVIVGFAPYFVWLVIVVVSVLAAEHAVNGPPPPREHASRAVGFVGALVVLGVSAGLVLFGYLPAFFDPIVKSQRAVFGDLFLIVVTVYLVSRVLAKGLVGARVLLAILLVTLVASDVYYLRVTGAVNHDTDHSPVFDFDLSDGPVRHDLVLAIDIVKQQVEDEGAGVVVYYPRAYSENTTDPGMFFARFLRHFGRYRRPELRFACRWCDVKYGCPFPEVEARRCASTCCWRNPLPELRRSPALAGRKLYLWWYNDPEPQKVPRVKKEKVLRRFQRRYDLVRVPVPPLASTWECYALEPRARSARLSTLYIGVSGSSPTTVRPSGRLKLASSSPTHARSSASVGGAAGSRGTTKAQPFSPNTSSGTPITAARATFGWSASRSSISAG